MIELLNWFSRKFACDLPEWMYPNLLERLRGTPARLEDILRDVSADVLTRRTDEHWSIQENAGHMWDLEELWMGRTGDFKAGVEELRPADLQNTKTYQADHNSRPITEILAGFRKERTQLMRELDAADDALVSRVAHHPRLNTEMRLIDLVHFVAEHDDHHLARISELKRKAGE